METVKQSFEKKIIINRRNKNINLVSVNLFSDVEDKKEIFLKSLSANGNKNRYKRYLGSPLRYAGGKSLAVGHIIEHIPVNIKRLVSPFFGGGSVEIACAKELGIEVMGFDIFDILVNYWQVQIQHNEELYAKLLNLEPDKSTYTQVKNELRAHWEGKKQLDKLTLASYYYFNHNLSYGPGFLGWMSSVYEDKKRYLTMLEKVKNFNVKNIWVECAHFKDIIASFQKEFLYLDPPYYLGEDSKMFTGIYPQRNFPIHHKNFEHELLRNLLYHHKGKFVLSYNDCPTIREWYKEFKIIEVKWQYTMGQGETRIGKNRIEKNLSHVKNSHEILIIKE